MGPSPTRRRWLQFSLRGLLIVVTLVAVWLGWNVHVVRQRKAALAEIRSMRSALYFDVGFTVCALALPSQRP